MGSGVVSAIGRQAAEPDRPVVAICGDGSFLMLGNEIASAAAQGISPVWIVINDARLGMIELGMKTKYGRSMASTYPLVDLAGLARLLGAESMVVSTPLALRCALRRRFAASASDKLRPIVFDVRIDRRYPPPGFSRMSRTSADRRVARDCSLHE